MPYPTANRKLRISLIPAVLILVLALAATACGDDDEAGGTATSTATPTPTMTPTPEPTSADTAFEIKMVPLISFDTDELTVPAGTEVTVRFDNQDTGTSHNWAAYTDDSASEAIAGANENICNAPCTGEVTLGPLDPGEYFFRCDVHPTQMVGTLTVR